MARAQEQQQSTSEQMRGKATEIGENIRELGDQAREVAREQYDNLRSRAGEMYDRGRERAQESTRDFEGPLDRADLAARSAEVGVAHGHRRGRRSVGQIHFHVRLAANVLHDFLNLGPLLLLLEESDFDVIECESAEAA